METLDQIIEGTAASELTNADRIAIGMFDIVRVLLA